MRSLLVMVAAGASACATSGAYQTADVVGRSGWEVGGDLSALRIVDPEGDDVTLVLPRAVGRFGLSDRFELGGSVGLDGVRGYGKVQVTPPGRGPIVSLAPGVRLLPLPSGGTGGGALVGLEQALFFGVPVGDAGQFVASARVAADVGRVDQNLAFLTYVGGTVGGSVTLGTWGRVHPELGVMTPVVVVTDATRFGPQALLVQAGVGFVVGRRSGDRVMRGAP